jgi:glycosyltransferase involved in cell wall biosynthesis
VAFAVGGVPEIIDDGVTGLLVQPFDVNLFAGAVDRLIEDEKIRKEFAENAKRIKRKEFRDWQAVCEKFASIVDQILSSKEPNAA